MAALAILVTAAPRLRRSLDDPRRITDIPRDWSPAAPDAPGLIDNGAPITYSQLWRAIELAGERLKERGVVSGDRREERISAGRAVNARGMTVNRCSNFDSSINRKGNPSNASA